MKRDTVCNGKTQVYLMNVFRNLKQCHVEERLPNFLYSQGQNLGGQNSG